ncbi:MAG: nucleotide sugar dehydrogenase [Candidatus Micrarchaeia archaeon]
MKLGVVGLGYVGLPLACLAAEKGLRVYGYDLDAAKVAAVNAGKAPFKEEYAARVLPKLKGKLEAGTTPAGLADCNVIAVCVPTPVDENKRPDLEPLASASRAVAKELRKGMLIVIESTIYPGTIEELVQPILEEGGLKAGVDFDLAHCPERIDPASKKWWVGNIPRVVGATTPEGAERARAFYASIIDAPITVVSTVKAAEASKIVENSFRDVNIAFVNELAKSFDVMGIDVTEVIRAASTKPFAFLPHYPGAGVGGHCISVDPYYLIDKAQRMGFEHKFLKLAREINESMPAYVAELAFSELKAAGVEPKKAVVSVLGVSYKANVDDPRESPSFAVQAAFKGKCRELKVFDPFLPSRSTVKTLDEALKSDCVVLVTAHDAFKALKPDALAKTGVKVFIDGRNVFDGKEFRLAGVRYRGVGKR